MARRPKSPPKGNTPRHSLTSAPQANGVAALARPDDITEFNIGRGHHQPLSLRRPLASRKGNDRGYFIVSPSGNAVLFRDVPIRNLGGYAAKQCGQACLTESSLKRD